MVGLCQPLYRQGPPPDNSVGSVAAQRSNSIKLYEEESGNYTVDHEPKISYERENRSCLPQFQEKAGFVSAKEVFVKFLQNIAKQV